VYLDEYWIDKYEVTNRQFAYFLNVTGYSNEFGREWKDFRDEDVRITGGAGSAGLREENASKSNSIGMASRRACILGG